MSRVTLRQLILGLSALCVLLAMASAMWASYRVQREMLIANTLEANRTYARKLAEGADMYLGDAQQEMAVDAGLIGRHWGDAPAMREILTGLYARSHRFNSVMTVDRHGVVTDVLPAAAVAIGTRMDSQGAQRMLVERKPTISMPYRGTTGRLIIFISHPLVDAQGRYLGYVGGSIYLQQDNALHRLLGWHYYHNGSYLYVVDAARELICYPDRTQIGRKIGENAAIDQVLAGKGGSLQLHNSRGVDMLAGYAPLHRVHWGVVAQRPLAATLAGSGRLLWRTQLYSIPLFLVVLLILWWLSHLITLPLWQLANQTQMMDRSSSLEDIRRVRSWYFEADQIKRSIMIGLGLLNQHIRQLNQASSTDPLTGLYNRRGMQAWLEQAAREGRSYAVLQMDIDHFKRVNDIWGHDAGDKVLRMLADIIRAGLRPGDLPCRLGGEEFTVLLPDIEPDAAWTVAERLRLQVAQATWSIPVPLTISVGLAHLPASGNDGDQVLKQADEALYEAKRAGRNRVVRAPAA